MRPLQRALAAVLLVSCPVALVAVACSRDLPIVEPKDGGPPDVLVPEGGEGGEDVRDGGEGGQPGDSGDGGDLRDAAAALLRVIAAGTQYVGAGSTCVVRDGGALCWGADEYGQLGRGGDASTRQVGAFDRSPAYVVGIEGGVLDGVRAISLGNASACALRGDRVVCWGDDGAGQLGADTRNRYNPRPIPVRPALPLDGITQLACGAQHCLVATSSGSVFAWGSNIISQLSDAGPSPAAFLPVLIPSLAGARHLAAGRFHSCAVDANGNVVCWGLNELRQAGQASGAICNENGILWPCVPTPKPVTGLSNVVELALARNHACARGANGDVYCWGDARYGQLGTDPDSGTVPCSFGDAAPPCSEQPRLAIAGAQRIAAGGAISCAVKNGDVWCWGSDDAAQRGQGTNVSVTPFPVPVQVQQTGGIPLTGVADIAAGETHCCALKQSGEVWCWGSDMQGGLGPGSDVALVARRVNLP